MLMASNRAKSMNDVVDFINTALKPLTISASYSTLDGADSPNGPDSGRGIRFPYGDRNPRDDLRSDAMRSDRNPRVPDNRRLPDENDLNRPRTFSSFNPDPLYPESSRYRETDNVGRYPMGDDPREADSRYGDDLRGRGPWDDSRYPDDTRQRPWDDPRSDDLSGRDSWDNRRSPRDDPLLRDDRYSV